MVSASMGEQRSKIKTTWFSPTLSNAGSAYSQPKVNAAPIRKGYAYFQSAVAFDCSEERTGICDATLVSVATCQGRSVATGIC